MKGYINNSGERGAAILEFTLTAAFFFMMLVVIVSGGVLFFTHNALVESTRRGARYAAMQCNPSDTNCPCYATAATRIQNVVLYGTPTAGTTPLVPGLQASNVSVIYNGFGVGQGTVSVNVVNYDYTFFAVGGIVVHMPQYQTTLVGESAGYYTCSGTPPACP